MPGHNLNAMIAAAGAGSYGIGTADRPSLISGSGAPDNTTDVGMVYIRTDSGTTGDTVLYTWDDTASQWDAMTA